MRKASAGTTNGKSDRAVAGAPRDDEGQGGGEQKAGIWRWPRRYMPFGGRRQGMIGANGKNGERYEIVRTARNTRNIERHADLVTAIDGIMKSASSGLPHIVYGKYFRLPGEHKSS